MLRSPGLRLVIVLAIIVLFLLRAYGVIGSGNAFVVIVTALAVLSFVTFLMSVTLVGLREPIDLDAYARDLRLRQSIAANLGLGVADMAGTGNVDIVLVDPGQRKIGVMKSLRELYDVGLAPAKAMVEAAPVVIRKGVSRQEAEYASAYLTQAGAKIELREA
jgi:ribosomal protein L7/L12